MKIPAMIILCSLTLGAAVLAQRPGANSKADTFIINVPVELKEMSPDAKKFSLRLSFVNWDGWQTVRKTETRPIEGGTFSGVVPFALRASEISAVKGYWISLSLTNAAGYEEVPSYKATGFLQVKPQTNLRSVAQGTFGNERPGTANAAGTGTGRPLPRGSNDAVLRNQNRLRRGPVAPTAEPRP